MKQDWQRVAFWAVVASLVAGIFAFSQIGVCIEDEGFHLLAAQLILSGKRPYIDFFYQHPPLYIYVTAGWMLIFGDTWRSAHALSALFTGGCILLVADYLYDRWREQTGGLAVALAATLFLGLNYDVIRFGTIGQPYAFCLFFCIASFRLTIKARDTHGRLLPLWAGLCAGAAVASSLLSVPVPLVLLFWMLWHDKSENRLSNGLKFLGGALIPFAPLLWLFAHGPRQVFLDVFQFHIYYRVPSTNTANFMGNLKTLTRLITDSPGPFFVLLAIVGWIRLRNNNDGNGNQKAEFQLCIGLIVSLAIYLTIPLPTFGQYFVFLVPFVAIVASAGIYAICTSVTLGDRVRWLMIAVIVLTGTNLREIYGGVHWANSGWQRYEGAARIVNRVTPPGGSLYADETLYFVSRRLPPAGLENSFGVENLPPTLATVSHAAPEAQIDEWLAAEYFDTVVLRIHDPRVERFLMSGRYVRSEEIELNNWKYYLFWKR